GGGGAGAGGARWAYPRRAVARSRPRGAVACRPDSCRPRSRARADRRPAATARSRRSPRSPSRDRHVSSRHVSWPSSRRRHQSFTRRPKLSSNIDILAMATSPSANPQEVPASDAPSPTTAARRGAMAGLAPARAEEIEQGLRAVLDPVDYVELRAPETGLVMLRGRIGGDGAAFNLGEATVTRAAIQIASGEVGVAYILGRDPQKARLSAVCD